MSKIMGTEQRLAKIKKLLVIYYILEPIIFIAGVVVTMLMRYNWYVFGLLAIGICYVALGYNISNLIDDYVKLLYPQCYSLKNRPNNTRIKSEARKNNDNLTVNLKNHQSGMFALCAFLIIVLCFFGLILS